MSHPIRFSLIAGLFFFSYVDPSQAQSKSLDDSQKGAAAYNLGNYEEALQYYKYAVEDDPDSWSAYEQEGYCYFHLKRQKEMKEAFNNSLKLHPENPGLKAFLAGLPKQPTPVPTKTVASVQNPRAQKSPGGPGASSFRLNLSGALGYGLLGDLSNAALNWNQALAKYHAQGSASTNQIGIQFGLEGGWDLDQTNGLSLQAGFETGHSFQENLVYSSPVTLNISPQVFILGLNYYRFFPAGHGRFFLTGGLLGAEAVVDFYQDDPLETIKGSLVGTGFGFNLGGGQEWNLSPVVGLQMTARFRYLSVPKVQNTYSVASVSGTGQAVLATDSLGDLGLMDPQGVGQGGFRYAVMDYTGFTIAFSLNFHML